MPSFHPIASAAIALAAASSSLSHARTPAGSPLLGQWQFETAVGTTTTQGVATDDIGKGILTVGRTPDGLAATISWLDEQGQVMSARQVQGRATAGGAVFSHQGQRVSNSRDGRDIATDVTIRWTLQADGDRLRGQRLVETDEDEPKPVTGRRVDPRQARPAAALLPAPAAIATAASPVARGPSTPEERARVLALAREAQTAPRQVQQRDGAWLKTWVNEIPDLVFEPGTVYAWLKGAASPALRDALRFQYLAGAMAFQIAQPGPGQQAALDVAAMDGVLRAYAVLLRDDASQASPRLDRALAASGRGELPAFLGALSGRDPFPPHTTASGQDAPADPVVRRMLALSRNEPRAMAWLDILSNRFGGRLTGSPAYTHAAAWTRTQLRQFGLQAELEEAGQMPTGFQRGPWSARMLAPVALPLRIATPAYTAGTSGVQRGRVALGPATLEEAQARASQFRDQWVLVGGSSNGSGRDGEYQYKPRAITLALSAAGALGTIQAGEEPLSSAAAAAPSWATLPTLPDIKLAESQYQDIRQRVKAGVEVTLEFDIRNGFSPGPVPYHNVVARIEGTEQPEKIVLLGAHLDSFDGGTGAADNGSGVASMIEAMRLLAAAGARPRHTIMMVAFAGEEMGLKGSTAFAERHAGQLPHMLMMLNRDARPGAISSIAIPSRWKHIFDRVESDLRGAHPVFEFDAVIDDTPREGAAGAGRASSDDSVFAAHGVPTPRFAALTDFDYERVHHTVADTYDNVLPFRSAQQYSALALAIIAYEVANEVANEAEQPGREGYSRP